MPDQLFAQFRLETAPPSVESVRRRGDRRRRRAAAAAATAGAAAVVAVVAPIVHLAGGVDRGAPDPAQRDTVQPVSSAWVTTVSRSFDLAAGMATTPMPRQEKLPDPRLLMATPTVLPLDLGGCDAPLWQSTDPRDTLLAQWTDHREAAELRSLSPYADGAAATAAFERIRHGVGGCPGGPLSPVAVPLDGSPLGPQSVAWVQPHVGKPGGTPDGTGTAYVVALVHNALIVDRASMNGAGDAQARRLTVDHLGQRLSGVVTEAAAAFPAPGPGR